MGRLPTNNRNYQIKAIQDNHREILRRLALGQSAKQIAGDLGCTTAVVSYVKNSRLGRGELDNLQLSRDSAVKDLSQQIKEAAPEAFQVLLSLMRDDANTPRALRAKIAMDNLDRAGLSPVKKVANFDALLTLEEIESLKERAKSVGIKAGNVVEGEFTEA
jgi:uncharacterized protein YerC